MVATGRREQHKHQTRATLERVAVDLFTRRGFDHVTIDDITAVAGVSKRTFYRYFEAKEDLLLAEQQEIRDLVHTAIQRRPLDEPLVDALCNALHEAGPDLRTTDALVLDKTRLLIETPSLAARLAHIHWTWEQSFTQLVAERLGCTDPDDPRPALLAAALLSALRVAMQRWMADPARASFDEELSRHLVLLRTALQDL